MTETMIEIEREKLSLEALIEKRHNDPSWCILQEVADGTGYKTKRHADAIAIGIWPSRGYEIHGYEVKRSRGDVQKELNEPAKADAVGDYCDFWWLVVSDLKIIDGIVVPEQWGILYPKSQVLRVHRKAPRRKTKPITRAFNAAIVRRVFAEYVPRWQLAELERKTIADAEARVAMQSKYAIDNSVREVEDLKKRITAFEKVSGVELGELSSWAMGDIAEAVKVVVETRKLAQTGAGWNSPKQLVQGEIANIDRSIKNHKIAQDTLESARARLEILRDTLDGPTIPELSE